ncbi:hypothetical protein ACFLUO_07335 [Chloroflexota bacterium]
MMWIPPITSTYVTLGRLASDENPLKDSTELFWHFCNGSLSPEEFIENINGWKERAPDADGFFDPKQKAFMLRAYENPTEAAQIIVDRIDLLIEKKRVQYTPDKPGPPIELYVYLHLETTSLYRLLNVQAYSEKTREVLDDAINTYIRCSRSIDLYSNTPWSHEYSVSLEAVGSFLYITNFFVKNTDGDYEDALDALLTGIQHIQVAQTLLTSNRHHMFESDLLVPYSSMSYDIRKSARWMQNLRPQTAVDCFEAIRKGNRINDVNKLYNMCESFLGIYDEPWLKNIKSESQWLMPWQEKNEVERIIDTDGIYWRQPSDFWLKRLGWVEAQLTPSDFKTILDEREEQAAEKRLKKYFFKEDLWNQLPDRTRSSLISADRDWFGGSSARIEAILNELRIAVEELLIQEFWKPLGQWFDKHGRNCQGSQSFLDLKMELENKRKVPTILDFEHICKMQISGTYLVNKGVTREDRVWFIQSLQKSLFPLRRARNRAEHESDTQLTHEELNKYYNEFIGIGQPGIVEKLSELLFSLNRERKN